MPSISRFCKSYRLLSICVSIKLLDHLMAAMQLYYSNNIINTYTGMMMTLLHYLHYVIRKYCQMTVTTDSAADIYELSLMVVCESTSREGVLRKNKSEALISTWSCSEIT
ncbi:hypothetical protein RIR_jg23725.t1 [Rhizophagus irregularis DAOM 181602=DAOM 197198]|nr:hypothetical protein RIR_jg23725.t1 [Rhizophagus irregularis DAOM 181602=DAOM 197198]